MTLRWVRKRDGRRVPFDQRKLAASIAAAARAAGEEARVPHDEIALIVSVFLEKEFHERIPETRELEDLVEKALLETNHARTGAVYVEHRKERVRTRSEISVHRAGAPVAPDGEPLSGPPGEPWSEGRIVASLERRRVEPAFAEEIAASVERRIFALGFKRIPAALVREVLNAELAERGLAARIGRPTELSVPSEEVRQLLVGTYIRRGAGGQAGPPGGPEAAVGQDVLARYALREIYPPEVADAHMDGTIHIQDLGRPLRLTSAALSLESLKARSPSRGNGPRSLGDLAASLARTIVPLLGTHARAIGVPYANVFLAPFMRGKEMAMRRELRELVRMIPRTSERPVMRLHVAPVPPALRGIPVLGPRGRRWKATYGDLSGEVERCGRLLVEAAREEAGVHDDTRAERSELGLVVTMGGAPWPALAESAAAIMVEAPGLEPPRSRGLCSPLEVAALDGGARPIAAGAATVVALNCARAAYRAGRCDEPAFRREIMRAQLLAIEALAAKWSFLESAVYRPKLPLWDRASSPRAPAGAVVDPDQATQVIALVGLWEALDFLLGEPPDANAEVAALLVALLSDLAAHAQEEGTRRGLKIRIEEPELERASWRIADLDLTRFKEAAEILKLADEPTAEGASAARLRYGTSIGGTLPDLYRPVGLTPYLDDGSRLEHAGRLLAALGREHTRADRTRKDGDVPAAASASRDSS